MTGLQQAKTEIQRCRDNPGAVLAELDEYKNRAYMAESEIADQRECVAQFLVAYANHLPLAAADSLAQRFGVSVKIRRGPGY